MYVPDSNLITYKCINKKLADLYKNFRISAIYPSEQLYVLHKSRFA